MTPCRATYQDLGYQCEDEAGHSGPHWFTATQEWWSCWSCHRESGQPHERPHCEAVREPDEDVDAELGPIIVGQEKPGDLLSEEEVAIRMGESRRKQDEWFAQLQATRTVTA